MERKQKPPFSRRLSKAESSTYGFTVRQIPYFSRATSWFRVTPWGIARLEHPIVVQNMYQKRTLVSGSKLGQQHVVTA